METTLQDLRYAVRAFGQQPGFAAIAVVTLAVGIGANTAIYSVVNATLLRPLPYKDPGRLMRVSLIMPSFHGHPAMDMVWSHLKYEAFRKLQGVIAYVVTQRTREIGIRMALGARPGAVLGMVVRHGGALAAAGIIAGTLGALAVTRVLTTLLYGVRPDDSATYVTICFALLAVALAASYIPARRAAAVDPSSALRGD